LNKKTGKRECNSTSINYHSQTSTSIQSKNSQYYKSAKAKEISTHHNYIPTL